MKVKRTMRVLMIASYLKRISKPTSYENFVYAHSLKHYIWSYYKS